MANLPYMYIPTWDSRAPLPQELLIVGMQMELLLLIVVLTPQWCLRGEAVHVIRKMNMDF